MSLKRTFAQLAHHIPELLRLRNGSLLPTHASPYLTQYGLADDQGLTRKGQQALTHLSALALLFDLELA